MMSRCRYWYRVISRYSAKSTLLGIGAVPHDTLNRVLKHSVDTKRCRSDLKADAITYKVKATTRTFVHANVLVVALTLYVIALL